MTPQMFEASILRSKITTTVNLPYVATSLMTLGGEDRPSLAVVLSLDARESWINGIYENSRFATILFHFSRSGEGGKIANAATCHTLKPIRQVKFKNANDAMRLLNRWIASQPG